MKKCIGLIGVWILLSFAGGSAWGGGLRAPELKCTIKFIVQESQWNATCDWGTPEVVGATSYELLYGPPGIDLKNMFSSDRGKETSFSIKLQEGAAYDVAVRAHTTKEQYNSKLSSTSEIVAVRVEDADGDGWSKAKGDCDDLNANVFPGNIENNSVKCSDNVDNDCSGAKDIADANCNCVDHDRDGSYVGAAWCGDPGTQDCDDNEANAHPGNVPESDGNSCSDGIDNDCNGLVDKTDPGCGCEDADGDEYYSARSPAWCGPVFDCNDGQNGVFPGNEENCGDGVDSNCDGQDPSCPCTDEDGDGYYVESSCGSTEPVTCDSDPERNPGMPVDCTKVAENPNYDGNCNGIPDVDEKECAVCIDSDGDGTYADVGVSWCVPIDCDDTLADISPNAREVCDDGVDNNCDGRVDEGSCVSCPDNDGDGYYGYAPGCFALDCNDDTSLVHPGLAENCTDGLDNDCDGYVDYSDTDCNNGAVCGNKRVERGEICDGNAIEFPDDGGPAGHIICYVMCSSDCRSIVDFMCFNY